MIAKFQWIVKRMITRNELPRKARVVNPSRANLPDSRVILVNYGEGDLKVVTL